MNWGIMQDKWKYTSLNEVPGVVKTVQMKMMGKGRIDASDIIHPTTLAQAGKM